MDKIMLNYNWRHMIFRCYSDYKLKEKICWTFYPIKKEDVDNWVDVVYGDYSRRMLVFKTDYERLLQEYVTTIYPITDPYDGTIETGFDFTSYNFIAKSDWLRIINKIEEVLQRSSQRPPWCEKEFYFNFLAWITRELEWADYIIIDCNL